MKLRYWVLLGIIGSLIVIPAISMMPGTAIVDATIIRTGYVGHQFQLIVNATKAFPNFPLFTMSQCPGHQIGEHLFIGVRVANGWGGRPLWDEAELFKEEGVHFVPWNGCD